MTDRTVVAADIFKGTVDVVSAYLSNNVLPHDRVADFIRAVSDELRGSVSTATSMTAAPQSEIAAPQAAAQIAAPSLAIAAPEATAPSEATVATTEDAVTETASMTEAPAAEAGKFDHLSKVPIMPVGQSVTNDLVYCLFDGVGKKMLKRWLRAKYAMEEHEYRAHFGLPAEYPLTAPGYSGEKSLYAKFQGLGTDKIPKTPKAAPADNVRELARAA